MKLRKSILLSVLSLSLCFAVPHIVSAAGPLAENYYFSDPGIGTTDQISSMLNGMGYASYY